MKDDSRERDEEALVERARTALARDAESLDAPTRAKLSAARRNALDALEPAKPALQTGWLPVGVAAAATLVAVGVAFSARTPTPDAALEPASELEVLLGEDDPALYDEDLEFYAWLEEQTVATPATDDDAG